MKLGTALAVAPLLLAVNCYAVAVSASPFWRVINALGAAVMGAAIGIGTVAALMRRQLDRPPA